MNEKCIYMVLEFVDEDLRMFINRLIQKKQVMELKLIKVSSVLVFTFIIKLLKVLIENYIFNRQIPMLFS